MIREDKVGTRVRKFSPEFQERAVPPAAEQAKKQGSQRAEICSIAEKTGCTPETLPRWVKLSEPTQVMSADDRERINQLERENRELKRTNKILRAASVIFAKVEFDRSAPPCRSLLPLTTGPKLSILT